MGQKTIPQLNEATTVNDNTLVPIDSGTQSYKITVANLGVSFYTRRESITDVASGSQTMAKGISYRSTDNSSVVTFVTPSTAAKGDVFKVMGFGSAGFKLNVGGGQSIVFGTATQSGNTNCIQSRQRYSYVELVCVVANTTFAVTTISGDVNLVGYSQVGMAREFTDSAKTGNYQVLSSDSGKVIPFDTGAGAFNFTLPNPALGGVFTFKDVTGNAGINALTVIPFSGELVDGGNGSAFVTEAFAAITFITNGTNWYRIAYGTFGAVGGRGIVGGGDNVSPANNIYYMTINQAANAQNFGNLTVARSLIAALSSATRGIWGGGDVSSTLNNTMDYVVIATTGNAVDFGDLSVTRSSAAGLASGVRGIFVGGLSGPGTYSNVMDYIAQASTGNATDFGDLTNTSEQTSACASPTRGIRGGGANSIELNTIDYITIASTGNATNFGNLTVARHGLSSCSTAVRGLFGGGNVSGTSKNEIDYVTIASTGNATDFGDLTAARRGPGACGNATRAVFSGGYTSSTVDTMDYVQYSSPGNATDFGDLPAVRTFLAGCSDSHGGL